jgi:D-arabinose 1-dehydrogenase-like Zn-dependent alcohol dehydrogenase
MSNAITMSTPIGFVGLGIMGAAMARNLLNAGFKVTVHNRSKAKMETLVREGARPSAMTRDVFLNAVRTLGAVGGSTNAVIHLTAMARRLGVELSLADFQGLAAVGQLVLRQLEHPLFLLDVLLLLVEGLIRHDLSIKVKERFLQVGFVFLLLLVVFLVCNDILKTLRPY